MLNCAREVGAWAAREITKCFVNFSLGLQARVVKGGDRLVDRKQSITAKLALSAFQEVSRKRGCQTIFALQAKDRHPAAEDLEEFLFGRLPESQRLNIESHLRNCHPCSEDLVAAADMIGVLRKAMGIHELCASWPKSWESPTQLRLLRLVKRFRMQGVLAATPRLRRGFKSAETG
jgi:hypothetical protein